MKKKNFKFKLILILIIVFLLAAAVSIPVLIIYNRPPVLIICEQSFLELYGVKRVKHESLLSSAAIFRLVKTVPVANEASDDIISLAAGDEPTPPFCVIFPVRLAKAAMLYREQNPLIPVVLQEGRFPSNERTSLTIGADNPKYFFYSTDVDYDFYRAGTAAAAIVKAAQNAQNIEKETEDDTENQITGKIAVFWNTSFSGPINNFKQAISDFYQGTVKGISRSEQRTMNRKRGTRSSEQGTEINEQGSVSREQIAVSNEQIAENGVLGAEIDEQGAESGEQGAEREEQPAESEEQAVVEIEQARGGIEGVELAENNPENGNLLPETQFFSEFSQFNEDSRLSCVVIVDSGVEYLERKTGVPVIIFSWMDISIIPDDVVMVIDDSPWAQVNKIVKMVKAGEETGVIASKFHFLNKTLFDRDTIRKIKKIWKMIK